MAIRPLMERVEERVRAWAIVAEDTVETESSFIVFGRRGPLPVVLKVVRQRGDEWFSGEVLEALGGQGAVRVYEHVPGALLLERLEPGTQLAALSLNGRDEEATDILAEVIRQISSYKSSLAFVTVEDWGKGFDRYLESGNSQIPADLVRKGQQVYMALCESQKGARLLHGDLQHYNILLDSKRGWVAIDPKGIIGEVEYEIGASLRNPYERPELFASPEIVERRIRCFESRLKLDGHRALLWGFSQAVLSVIWSVEDGSTVDDSNPALMLANAIRQLIE